MTQGALGLYLGEGNTVEGWLFVALYFGGFFFCMIAGYLLGSINSAIIISKIRYGGDIRTSGSGNAGMTNVLRTYGKSSAALTFLGDAAKTALAYTVGALVFGVRGAYFACFMCVLGHVFPIFYRFRGGKGIVCAAIMILLLNPLAFLIILLVFIIVLIGYRYVSLASIMAAMIYPIANGWTMWVKFLYYQPWPGGSVTFAVLTSALVLWRHYPNMKRLLDRTEPKIDLGKLFGKKKDGEPDQIKGGKKKGKDNE